MPSATRARHADAVDCYDRAIAIDPAYSDGIAWGQKGCALQDLDRLDEAAACYEEVLKLNPSDARACLNIGTVRFDAGAHGRGVSWYRKALELDPRNRRAKAYLAEALAHGPGRFA